jgi:hypothetical protein
MSQAFMEGSFPFVGHEKEARIKQSVVLSLYPENPEGGSPYEEDAVVYTRSDWAAILRKLDEAGVQLTVDEEDELSEFASTYASLVDEEIDRAELNAMMKEGEE